MGVNTVGNNTTRYCNATQTLVQCDGDCGICINSFSYGGNTYAPLPQQQLRDDPAYRASMCSYNKKYNLCSLKCDSCNYNIDAVINNPTAITEIKCECGADKCGEPKHLDWCAKYGK